MNNTKNSFVRIIVVFIIVCTLSLSLIINVGAVTSDGSVTINLSNPNNIPFDNDFFVADSSYSIISFGVNNIPVTSFDSTMIYTVNNGYLIVDGESLPVNVPDGQYLWVQINTNMYDGAYQMQVTNYYYAVDIDGFTFYFANTVDIELVESEYHQNYLDFVLVLVQITDGSSSPTECPSLQVQINQYNGTFEQFEGMLLGSTNEVIYQGYRNKLQELFRQGQDSVTLEQLLADYDGSFQQLITLLSENNLRLLDEYTDYIEEQRTLSFNHGYAQGNEVGFNDGYNRGYNRGTSEVFGENLLGETFNMPLNALNNWVLFETSTGYDVTMGGLVTGLLALSILIILIKMFAGG